MVHSFNMNILLSLPHKLYKQFILFVMCMKIYITANVLVLFKLSLVIKTSPTKATGVLSFWKYSSVLNIGVINCVMRIDVYVSVKNQLGKW